MSTLDDLLKLVRDESFTEEMEQMGHGATAELEAIYCKLRDLKDTNTALIIYNRRIRIVITLCVKVFDTLDNAGALFLPPSVKDAIKQAREQVAKLDHSLASSLEICESAPTLVTADAKNAPLNS